MSIQELPYDDLPDYSDLTPEHTKNNLYNPYTDNTIDAESDSVSIQSSHDSDTNHGLNENMPLIVNNEGDNNDNDDNSVEAVYRCGVCIGLGCTILWLFVL
jgi:hypothetical protein